MRHIRGADVQRLYRKARELGLAEVYSTKLAAQSRRIAHQSGQEIERRLMDNP